MRFSRKTLLIALVGLLAVAVAGTNAVERSRDKREAGRLTQRMKTVCIGRMLIDFPEEAELNLRRARIDGFDIEAYAESKEDFHKGLEAREAQLRATPDRLGGNKNLEMVRELRTKAGLVGKMFVHGREVTEGTAANGLGTETYRYENVALEAFVHANGLSIDIVAPTYNPSLIENLHRLVSQLVPNPEHAIPRESGYCIDRAFVRDPLTPDHLEQITMFGRLKGNPDVTFELFFAAGLTPDRQTLLERDGGSSLLDLIDFWRISRLRAVRRTITGIEGDELVRRFVEENDAVVHNFTWEANGTKEDVFVPHVLLMMDTGKSQNGPVPSSLSEGAAFGLWDAITSSIRLHHPRPGDRSESRKNG
jgi:hypothetical protein